MKCFLEYNIQASSGKYLPASHYAIKMKKLYIHSKNKKEISSFVYQHLILEDALHCFVLGQPVDFWKTIHERIIKFSQQKKEENIEAGIT